MGCTESVAASEPARPLYSAEYKKKNDDGSRIQKRRKWSKK